MTKSMEPKKWDEILERGYLEAEDHQNATDWEMRYKQGNDSKYGSLMYSPSLNQFRARTFTEFYGDGIVD